MVQYTLIQVELLFNLFEPKLPSFGILWGGKKVHFRAGFDSHHICYDDLCFYFFNCEEFNHS